MLKILKAEIEYFKILVGIIVLLPIIFSVFAITNTLGFNKTNFLDKFFWAILVGLGTYFFVFILWTIRKKEARERLHAVLPLGLFKISIVRWLLGISPFLATWIYLEISRVFISANYLIYIDGIIAQLGLLFIFIVSFDITLNYSYALLNTEVLHLIIVPVIIIAISVTIIYLVAFSIIPPFIFGGSEFYFMSWGLLLSIWDAYVFRKRKSYLG